MVEYDVRGRVWGRLPDDGAFGDTPGVRAHCDAANLFAAIPVHLGEPGFNSALRNAIVET